MPIFDFGRTKGNLRYAEASRDVALARYEQSIQSAFREVADALAQRETIGTQLDALTSLRNAASGAYRLSEARYRAGIEPFLNRSEEHTSELQSLMRISYAVFCLKKKNNKTKIS